MQRTKIQYLDYTWNPIAMQCTPISTGCANCWHLAMAKRLAKNPIIDRDAQRAYFGIDGPSMNYVELKAPLHLKKPSRIGVQFMGDLFHKDVSWSQRISIFETITNASHHQYLILTKRPENAKSFFQLCEDWDSLEWPNVWLGVSVENQQTADERIPILLQIPAAKRFVSVEPMLSDIDLLKYLDPYSRRLDYVICGCESGSKRRTTETNWIRNLRDQCIYTDVPFFLKQMEIDGKIVKMPKLDGKEHRGIP